MTPQQREALKQALDQHSLKMAVKDAAPEDVAALPQDFAVPSYNENNKPLYDNQLFPAVNSVDDLVARGYATQDGQVTENGQMALSLKKVGALNDDYTLNDTGKAMMASRQDLLKEENLPLYMKSKEIGLDDTGELSWGEVGTNFINQLKEGGKNLIDLASFDTSSMTPEQQAEFQLKSQAAGSGFVKAGATLATGAAQIIGTGTVKALVEDEETQKTAKALLDQKVERVSDDINNTNTAEFIDALGEMSGVNLNLQEGREQAIALVGEEKAQEFERAGESAGGFAAMFNPYGPSMLTAKVAFGAAGKGLGAAFKPISRSLLQADAKAAMVLDKTKQLATLERQATGLQLATQTAEKQAVLAENMAQKFSQAGFADRANNALRLANQARTKGQEAAARLGGFTDEIATVSDDLAKATQSATVADKVLQMTQKASQVPYLPITLLGKSLEYTGRGMIGIDKGLASMASKVGADKVYNAMNKITTLSGLGGVGVASGFGPAAFIPAAIKATWSTAPFIKATGEYVGLMGKEAMKARGQIGFWKRMYEMPNKGPMHRAVSGLMDTATLGGRVTGAAGRVGKGLAASYPVDLAFEWVAEGGEMNPNVLKQAAVETLVFGGTGAALGGITMGSAERIRSLQNGDATNFYRSITDPSQRVMFNGMAPDLKRAIGTFSASNPGAKVEFVTQGEGVYDRNTKTVMVNPNARNPLKPLLTHEFMHHMLNNGIGDGVVAQLVGDGYQTGGILRSKDGGYEQQYEAFKSEYVNRLRQQHERNIKLRDAIGDPVSKSERAFQVPDEKYLAEEYFIETNVDDMLGLVESGKLGKMAGRMVLNDKVRALGDAILNKSAILRDLHFRIGGVMDKQGKMVKGNGFLGGQLYQSPEIRRMFNKMVNESVGRRGGIDAAKMKARNGIELPISGKNDPILGEMSSLWESDADGNPLIDKNGDYIPLSKQTDELRSQAGMLLVDDLRARQSRGEAIPDGELAYNPENNTWSGQYLNDRQIELLALSGRFNSKQIKQLKLMNESARATSDPNADPATRGHRFSVIYQPALKKNRKGQWRYDQIKPQLRDVVPYGVEISKDGNILIRIMSTNQLFANASEKATSKRGRSLYDGNMDSILRDANAIIDLHGKNQATDAYFKDKYGAQWASHKEFINSVFGNVGKGHKDINPLVASDRVDAVVKSYRLDRMNKATQLVGATQLPYQNNLIKINYLPEGEPILDANGEPKDLRYTPRYEERMPEQRYMPEVAVVPERFTGSKEDVDRRGKYVEPPGFFKRFNIDSYERGGRFFDAANGEDLTGKQYSTGSIDVSTGKPRLFVDNISDVTKSGAKFKTNLFKQSAGWKWTSENPPSTSTIVSVEGQGKHVYSLKANFESGVELARYSEKKSEPRLRPTAYGELKLGNQVGEISIRGKLHPVYDSIGVTSKAQGSRLMPEVSPENLNPVANKQEAQGLWADGKRMFALNEMDEKLTPITSKAMLDSYSADAIGWMEPEQATAPSQRFMPEPANPAAPNVPFKNPLSRTDPIPDIDSTLISDAVDINGFAFDRPAKVYMQHPNGERLYFNYDPAYLIKPEFKDLRKTLEGKNVIILEADRMRATGGDMGGPLHPFLRSNQVVVKGPDGKMYKAIWANMTSTFVTGTKNRWFNDDAQYALIHIMDENAHASNKRIARAINEAWKKANLSEYDQRVIAIAMQAAITSQEQSMLSTKITQANSKIKSGDLTDKQIKEYEKYIAGWLKERNSLAWTGINKDISSKISKIKTAQTRFQNKNGTKDSVDKAKANLKEYLAAKPEHLAAFNELSNKSSSFEIADNIGKTFQSRGAAIKGLLGIEAGKFNASDILSKTEDFKGGENMDIVGAVQLSKNKDIFAVYFGNDPKEEAAMSDSERQIRDKLRADPSFVEHEAFDWMMLGPENADNFIAESSLKPEELLPDYRSKHPKASVKDGSEETVLGAMKKNAEIPLSVKKYTPAQIKQIQKNRKAWIADRKAKEARKKQVQSLKAKIKQRDASITKLDKMLSVANEAEASAIVAKQSKAESEKKELADQIKTLQNLK